MDLSTGEILSGSKWPDLVQQASTAVRKCFEGGHTQEWRRTDPDEQQQQQQKQPQWPAEKRDTFSHQPTDEPIPTLEDADKGRSLVPPHSSDGTMEGPVSPESGLSSPPQVLPAKDALPVRLVRRLRCLSSDYRLVHPWSSTQQHTTYPGWAQVQIHVCILCIP